MKKISTLFKKDPNDLGRVINEVNPENQWVFDGFGIPTRKFDGTSTAIFDDNLYKRFDVKLWKKKKGKTIVFTAEQLKAKIPVGAISCQNPDEKSGHWPHWVLCNRNNPADKYHFEAFDKKEFKDNGTYELCGPRINGNPEKLNEHVLITHGFEKCLIENYTFKSIKSFLQAYDIEGIVFHHKTDDRMCKIRKTDFGIVRD